MIEIGNHSFVFDSHPYPVRVMDCYDAYEPEIVNVIERVVKPGHCAVDVGASVGFHTCLLSKLVGPMGLVLAFEPHGKSREHLINHIKANQLTNVAPFNIALWSEDRPNMDLWSIPFIGYSTMYRHPQIHDSSESVPVRALDSFLLEEQPNFMKIDCEGSEYEVLLGAQEKLARGIDCIILEFNYFILQNIKQSDMAVRELLAHFGYSMYLVNLGDKKGGFLPPLLVPLGTKLQLEGGHFINVMFMREERMKKLWSELRTNN